MQIYGPKLYRETDAGINNHYCLKQKNNIFSQLSFGHIKRNRIFQPLDQDEADLGPRLHRDFARPPSWVRGRRRVGLFRSVCSSPEVDGGSHIQQRQLH